ncbi:MAG: response regulator transcription factor [Chitinophagaceae bacterium]|jgi:DNA-binding NarL/FixJ family response regulator|nr:response regulator transcription factor [Chitinophagaceae bacterium]MBK7679726.1 response regulator transcription factor [Chitinophagaceae bacterium]MBK8298921.1 response regulator transcription factor [Chitinophagaceae bacterium]MBK9464743.1 response regulator transcription factor [Chitinophagaceae bacterium]MBK9659898.1 response regulator transcription factor [Chitinophagaceae bacterium]
MSKLRVLIVEDEPVIAENISMYLDNNDFEVSGIAYDSAEANEQLQSNTPDAAILDVNLESDEDGIDIASSINQKYQIPFLFLTSYSDKETLERAKKVKPSGYIVKPFNEKTLLASLEIAISNFTAEKNHSLPPLNHDKLNYYLLSPISEREFELVQQLYEGITNTQIADKLFISVNTVKTHLKNIYLKLDAGTRIEVIRRLREIMMR